MLLDAIFRLSPWGAAVGFFLWGITYLVLHIIPEDQVLFTMLGALVGGAVVGAIVREFF